MAGRIVATEPIWPARARYPTREGPLGRAAHLALFEAFEGPKQRRV